MSTSSRRTSYTLPGVVVGLICCVLPGRGRAQDTVFGLAKPVASTLELDTTISSSGETIDLSELGAVGGLALSASVTLEQPSSFVRIILEDDQGAEHQVFESNTLLDSVSPVELDTFCEETCSLGNVTVSKLHVLLDGAQVRLSNVSVSEPDRSDTEVDRSRTLATRRASSQLTNKLQRVQDGIRASGYQWIAGETPMAKMSYAEKKQHSCGPLNNLFGFEYYVGGIFQLPDLGTERAQSSAAESSRYVGEFSWRDRHGQDWLTSVKDQDGCGSCWAFAATGTTELLTNIYFNQHADLDLSEQDALSCSGAGTCTGGAPELTLEYYATEGVVDEGCFPYEAADLMCGDKCTEPKDVVTIGGVTAFDGSTQSEDDLKAMLLQGAVSGGIYWWTHAMTLVGFKVLEAGDQIYFRDENNGPGYITIAEGDALVGRTAWRFKNSWGSAWGDEGYVYVVTDISNIGWTVGANPPVTTKHLSDADIVCEDADGDGYYSWGVGPMPSSCPADVSAEPDGDDSDGCRGPMNEYGFMAELCEVDEIDLGHIAHLNGLITDGAVPLRISDWPFWWKEHAPETVFIHFKAFFSETLDGLSVEVSGVRIDLHGHHDVVSVPNTYPEPMHVVVHADRRQKLIVAWRGIRTHW